MALRITNVSVLNYSRMLGVELSDGSLLLLSFGTLLSGAGRTALRGKEPLPRPLTDGRSVFWQDGPRLTLAEIFNLLTERESGQK